MRSQARFHRRSHPQALMHLREVVVHVEQRDGVRVVLDLLGEGVRQAREAAQASGIRSWNCSGSGKRTPGGAPAIVAVNCA